MKSVYVLLISLVLSPIASQALETVPYVDVQQYVGTWYQIARNPLFFENGCVCSQQKLSLKPDGTVGVFNSCNDGTINGPLKIIEGYAVNQDPVSNSKFLVDFNLPNKGDYWIIGLDPQYRYAVVSDPSKLSLYILSKTPELDPVLYQEAVSKAQEQVNTDKLLMTVQQGCTYP